MNGICALQMWWTATRLIQWRTSLVGIKTFQVNHYERVDRDEFKIVLKTETLPRKFTNKSWISEETICMCCVFQLSVLLIWMWVPAEEDSSGGFMMYLHTSAWSLHMEDAEETTTDSDHLRNVTICVWNTWEHVSIQSLLWRILWCIHESSEIKFVQRSLIANSQDTG